MSIDRIGRPDAHDDAEKAETAQPPVTDPPQSQKSVIEKLLDLTSEGRVFRRDNPREPDGGSTDSEMPRIQKPVAELLLDVSSEGRVINRDDPRELLGRSRSTVRSGADAPADAGRDAPREDQDPTGKDTRAAVHEPGEPNRRREASEPPDSADVLPGGDTDEPRDGEQAGNGDSDQASRGDAEGIPDLGEVEQEPGTDEGSDIVDELGDAGEGRDPIDLADRDLDEVRRAIKEEGLGPGDELYDALQEVNDAEKRQMGRAWSTFPKDADDATKAGWYREAAKAEGIPAYMRPILEGRAFNHEMYPTFRASEVTIHKIDPGTGERVLKSDGETPVAYRVDGIKRGQIISLKSTQIAEKPDAAMRAIDELVRKYNPLDRSLVVAPTEGNKMQLDPDAIGQQLVGRMILGVPEQKAPIPDEIRDYAEKRGITIRPMSPPSYGGNA